MSVSSKRRNVLKSKSKTLYKSNKGSSSKKHNNLVKKENKLLTKLDICKKTKCGSLHNKYKKQKKLFLQEQTKACPDKLSNNKFYECSTEFYENSDYKKLFDEYSKCGNSKCKTIKKSLKNIRLIIIQILLDTILYFNLYY